MNTTQTLTGTTARAITFSVVDLHTRATLAIRTFPAGTEVYARENKRGGLTVRIPGTLFDQHVNLCDVIPA